MQAVGGGLLLVDAKNAYGMHTYFGPGAAVFYLIHTVVTPRLLLKGSEHIFYSKVGVTQGDPLSMLFYAVAVLPLIQSLKQLSKWHQSWYADDSACTGKQQLVRTPVYKNVLYEKVGGI